MVYFFEFMCHVIYLYMICPQIRNASDAMHRCLFEVEFLLLLIHIIHGVALINSLNISQNIKFLLNIFYNFEQHFG